MTPESMPKSIGSTLFDDCERPRYRVKTDQYKSFRADGYLVVPGLVSPDEIAELKAHTEDLMQGKLPEQNREMNARDLARDSGTSAQALEAPPAHLTPDEKAQFFLRIHMLHRKMAFHERFMLHPRVLDVLEVLIGPDVLAMQTMLFLKPPGKPGQGWHQDSYYIPTHPDTLIGAWIAIDDADEKNGAMWMAKGSQHEPVYPPTTGYGFGDKRIGDIAYVGGVSNPNDDENDLAPIASRYDNVLAPVKAGDVVFFGGHVLHRSKANWTTDKYRRSFVSHYCNARSFTQWGGGEEAVPDAATGMTNASHILARGDTHLPFGLPRFGTPCAALLSPEARRAASQFAKIAAGDMPSGDMGVMPSDPYAEDSHEPKPGTYKSPRTEADLKM